MVRLLPRRNKKRFKQKPKSSGDTLSTGSIDTRSSANTSVKSSHTQSSLHAKKDNVSAITMYAHISTTIAATLSEKEFGKQQNNFYRPNAEYPSRVIHPVECKRDIFVESVTPVKNSRSRKSKSSSPSIYQPNVGREQSPYNQSNDIHYNPLKTGHRLEEQSRLVPNANGDQRKNVAYASPRNATMSPRGRFSSQMPYDERMAEGNNDDDTSLDYSLSDEDKENPPRRLLQKYAGDREGENKRGSMRRSHPLPPASFRPRVSENLRIETGRARTSEPARENNPVLNSANEDIKTFPEGAMGTRQSRGYSSPRNYTSPRHHYTSPRNLSSPRTYSSPKTALFRSNPGPNNTLRVETGRMGIASRNSDDHHMNAMYHGSPPESAYPSTFFRSNMGEVSPSSTVSSLTLPADLDGAYTYTPREQINHQATMPMITENDSNYTEI